jgi:hypothetical protein
MSEAFRLGGWGMYPTTIAGFILLACAWRFAMRPARDRLPVVLWLGALVSLTSMLGFVAGVIKTLLAAGSMSGNEAIGVVTAGIGESANNLGLGLSLLVMATIAIVVGHARRPSTGAELVDPLR